MNWYIKGIGMIVIMLLGMIIAILTLPYDYIFLVVTALIFFTIGLLTGAMIRNHCIAKYLPTKEDGSE